MSASLHSCWPRGVTVIGGGIIGLAVGELLGRSGVRVQILEKESAVGQHQSRHNSGVLHAGLYYRPGSLKAQLAVRGIRLMTAFCAENGVPFEVCGKLVVAVDEAEEGRLQALLERGRANGLQGLRWLEGDALREVEPAVAGRAAISVPEEGIVDYPKVCEVLKQKVEAAGGSVITGAKVTGLKRTGGEWIAETAERGSFHSSFLINCGGLYCDHLCRMAGGHPATRILPFRGEYYRLSQEAEGLVRNLIYPVPHPRFPFLGVHFTRLIHGGVEAGPNAVLAFAREGYRTRDINLAELAESLAFPGLWRFLARYPAMVGGELMQSLSKTLFCRALQRLVPAISLEHLAPGGAGVRAQAVDPGGELVQDFRFEWGEQSLHLLNAPSPGATASLAIAEHLVAEIVRR